MNKFKNIIIRVTESEKQKIEQNYKKFGFHSLSEYLRFVGINTKNIKVDTK